jgi:hypothetical protein
MSLEGFYFIAEITAAFAMIASLLFVGIQVRQNTAATQVSNSQASLHAWTDLTTSMSSDEGLSQIYVDSFYPDASTTDRDSLRLNNWVAAHLKTVEWNYLQWLDGNLSDDLWHGYRGAITLQWSLSSQFKEFWSLAGQSNYSDQFQDFMNKEIVGEGTAS